MIWRVQFGGLDTLTASVASANIYLTHDSPFLIVPLHIIWEPDVIDPAFMESLIIWAYLLAAIACGLRFCTAVSQTESQLQRWFWSGLTVILLLLGINKQMDILAQFTIWWRTLALQQQWWRERKAIQIGIVRAVVVAMITLGILGMWWLRHLSARHLLAYTGILLLVGFSLIQVTSWHAVDYYLHRSYVGIRLTWAIELGLVLFLLITAVFPSKPPRKNDVVPIQTS